MKLTFRQYQEMLIRKTVKETSCTLNDAAYCYPDHIVRKKHGEECFLAAQNNFILPLAVLDSLLPLQRYRIFHDLPDYLSHWVRTTGRAYINPQHRKESKLKFYNFRHSAFRNKKD